MTLAVVVAAAMFIGVVVYSLFGGADFGSGFYDLNSVRKLRRADELAAEGKTGEEEIAATPYPSGRPHTQTPARVPSMCFPAVKFRS